MTSFKPRLRRATQTAGAIAISASLVVVSAFPGVGAVAAMTAATNSQQSQPPLVNEQLVLATLDPSGLPSRTQLINRIVATNVPEQDVSMTSSTDQLRFLDKRGEPVVNGSQITYSVGGDGQTSSATQATFGKPLPVALHAEYATQGEGARGINPADVPDQSGNMKISYTLTNTVAKKQQITYSDAAGNEETKTEPVFAPFLGTVIVTLPKGIALDDPGKAVVSTTADGSTSLLWNVVLYPPLGSYQQTLNYSVSGDELAIPALKMQLIPVANSQDPAVGFSSNLLTESVKGNTKLAGGLQKIDDSTAELADGAAQLTDGQYQQATGTTQAVDGSKGITSGADQLSIGLTGLSTGLDQLATGLPAAAVATGDLADAVNKIVAGLGDESDPPLKFDPKNPPDNPTLVQVARLTQASVILARDGAAAVVAKNLATGKSVREVLVANCTPPTVVLPPADCQKLIQAIKDNAAASVISSGVAVGLQVINRQLLDGLILGLIQVSNALKSGSYTSPGVYEGLRQLRKSLLGAASASEQLSAGADQANTGARGLANASGQLTSGLDALAGGAGKLASGSSSLSSGASQLQTKGTGPMLDSVITNSAKPSFADAYLKAASARSGDAAPYPPPKGVVSRVAYVYTMDAPKKSNGLSPALLGIGALFVAGAGTAGYRRLKS